ncbi:molecular chaperone HtpG [Fimbriiglobus ruber]|uniref:Chaperone protein HtpG n=1 Tax=Fimbriiglobus ruber TaxID=1908690 RepID=A0A225D4J0_9BACT|nr:molecular chaperone HtpG [Fimbriiglobus ruber]OWK36500.1 Chaperone protein HtpG [Fimbriiglobus ruber]
MATAETLEFRAELKQLLHLITHSLYSDPEIFLRELISNASDAINKVKFNSLANEDQLEGNKDWKITITPDKDAKTLTISDNGIGMSREEVVDSLGTIAKSGTKAFLEAVKAKQSSDLPGLIGQFGVGFYSSFMVADKVTVHTRPAGGAALGVKWVSDGQGTYTIESAEKETRGTDVILHMKEESADFLEAWRLRNLVKKFSDFIEHPVVLVTREEKDGKTETTEDTLNSRKAVWLRSPREVTPEEYTEFYKTISHDHEPPAKVLHFSIEGKSEFRALLFIPATKPFSFDYEEQKAGLKLYVQRVLIMDKCEEVLPPYLRFVKGVIDSADLPLNVSRELLQQNPHLETIRKNVVRNILSGLEGLRNTEYEKYLTFYRGLGPVLKEGLARDWENREKVADLLLFETANTEPGKFATLAEYVEKMPAGQEKIHYLTGESAEQLRHSPYLEAFRAKGEDVLLMTDPIDEFTLPHLHEYKGKPLQAADKADAKTDDGDIPADVRESFAGLLIAARAHLPEVSDVRLTKRLTESASCLVADAGGMSAHLERILKRAGEAAGSTKRILELNPDNPAVAALRALHAKVPDDGRVGNFVRLFYEQAVIAEGSKVMDPSAFAKRVNELIVSTSSVA